MEIKILFLILIPLVTAFLIPLIDVIKKKIRKYLVFVSITAELILTFYIYFSNLNLINEGNFFLQYYLGGWKPPVGINLVMDNLSLLFLIFINLVFFLVALYSIGFVGHHEGKYYVLFFLLMTASQGVILTGDLFNIYVFIEMITITSASLVGFKRDKESSEAAVKYLFYNIIAGLFFFFAVILVYINLGTLNLAEIAVNFGILDQRILIFITGMFLISLLIKSGIFPFHYWMPKTYNAAPGQITAVLSGIISKVYLYIFIRMVWTVIGFEVIKNLNIAGLLLYTALFSSFLGHIFALQANNIKRLLAFSSMGHIGMIVSVLMINTQTAFYGGILHIIAHMFMKTGLFLIVGYLLKYTISNDIEDFVGMARQNRLVFTAFIIIILSMIGMPPLIGFASKWFILLAFLESKQYFGAFIVIFGSLTAVIYYLRYIYKGFEEIKLKDNKSERESLFNNPLFSVFYKEKIVTVITIVFAVLILLFGVSFTIFDININSAIMDILNPQRYIDFIILGG